MGTTRKAEQPESCRRGLSLLAPFGIEDARRKQVFADVKSMGRVDGVHTPASRE
jgi:hypothetical protein